jgi:hypothetical protein
MSRQILDPNNSGFFDFVLIQKVLDCKKNLGEAKVIATKAIDEYQNPHKDNLIKARALVRDAKTTTHLAMGMSSFILSYQGLGTISNKR